jgi:TRAP-type C4-dicarboxylate transport system substrate-binding protein
MMRILVFFLAVVLVAAGFSSAFAGKTLRYSNWLPATHPFNERVIQPWIEDVARVTDGRVIIDILPKVVGSVPGQYDVVRDGLADVGLIINGYTAGRFKAGEIAELPFLGDNPVALGIATWRIYKRRLEPLGEFAGTVPVATFTHGPGQLYTKSGPIESVSDLKGLKIRVASTSSIVTVEALGAVPVQKPVTQLYELMSTGVVDGTLMNKEASKGFNLIDSLPYMLLVPGGLYNLGISFVVNQDTWNEISESDRAAIMEVSGETFIRNIGNVYIDIDAAAVEAMKAAGNDVRMAEGALLAELKDALKASENAWIAKAEAAGLADAAAVLAEFRAEITKLEEELSN